MEGMKTYVGTKIIKATPMNERKYITEIRAADVPEDFVDREGYLVIYPLDNYKSWSPKDVFDNAYREITDGELELILE